MSAAFRPRYVAPAPEREPKPLRCLTRPQLAARVHVLRQVLDLLVDQMHADAGEPFRTIGRAKCELIDLEERLREMDRQAAKGEPLPTEVALAMVGGPPPVRAVHQIQAEASQAAREPTPAELDRWSFIDAARDAYYGDLLPRGEV